MLVLVTCVLHVASHLVAVRILMLVLSVDPATCSGYALWQDGKIIDSGTIKVAKKEKEAEFVHLRTMIYDKFFKLYIDVLVIELQYPPVHKNTVVSPKVVAQVMAGFKVSCIRGIWIGCIRAHKVVVVAPSTWESAVLSTKNRMKRDQIKDISRTVASSEVGRRPGSDEADAINIGRWYLTQANLTRTLQR